MLDDLADLEHGAERHGDRPRRGGNGECEADGACQTPAAPGTGFADHIVPVEADKVLDHMLGNDSRPHYVHQPQLTEDRTLCPLLDRVVGDYRAWFADSRSIVVPTMTQSAQELGRQHQWAEAVADGRVRAAGERTGHGGGGQCRPCRHPAGRAADARPVRGVRRSVRDRALGVGTGQRPAPDPGGGPVRTAR